MSLMFHSSPVSARPHPSWPTSPLLDGDRHDNRAATVGPRKGVVVRRITRTTDVYGSTVLRNLAALPSSTAAGSAGSNRTASLPSVCRRIRRDDVGVERLGRLPTPYKKTTALQGFSEHVQSGPLSAAGTGYWLAESLAPSSAGHPAAIANHSYRIVRPFDRQFQFCRQASSRWSKAFGNWKTGTDWISDEDSVSGCSDVSLTSPQVKPHLIHSQASSSADCYDSGVRDNPAVACSLLGNDDGVVAFSGPMPETGRDSRPAPCEDAMAAAASEADSGGIYEQSFNGNRKPLTRVTSSQVSNAAAVELRTTTNQRRRHRHHKALPDVYDRDLTAIERRSRRRFRRLGGRLTNAEFSYSTWSTAGRSSTKSEWENEFVDLLGVQMLACQSENINQSAVAMCVVENGDGDVRNFNQNAAPGAGDSSTEITAAEEEVGAGANEEVLQPAAEPAAASGGEEQPGQQTTGSQAERSAADDKVPSDEVTQVGATRSTEVNTSEEGLAPGHENGASSQNVMSPRAAAKLALAAKTRFRRCIAEDFQWCLKMVPNLDELVAQEIVRSFAGENHTSRHST